MPESGIKKTGPSSYYEQWLESEGIPVADGYFVKDLKTLPLKPWSRKGGQGSHIQLKGAQEIMSAYVVEISPGTSLKPQRHLFEEVFYVLQGSGTSKIWRNGEKPQTLMWKEGSLFSPPLNTWHEHENSDKNVPAKLLAMTNASMILNLFRSRDMVFNCPWEFKDRYASEDNYFSSEGKPYSEFPEFRIMQTNFVPDILELQPTEDSESGSGFSRMHINLVNNNLCSHFAIFEPGTYKKAHRHGPAAHIVIVKGKGYSLIWPEGGEKIRIDWQAGSMISPPNLWWHQHFNTGKEKVVQLAFHRVSRKHPGMNRMFNILAPPEGTYTFPRRIEYEDEDPQVRRLYEKELSKDGIAFKMPPFQKS